MDLKMRRSSYSEANQIPEFSSQKFINLTLESKEKESKACCALFAEDGCYLLDRNLTDLTEKQFYEFQGILKYAGLLFKATAPRHRIFIQYCWLLFLMCIGIYTCFYDMYNLAKLFDSKFAATVFVYAAVIFQATVSFIFLARWQRKLRFQAFFHAYRHSTIVDVDDFNEDHHRACRRNRIQFWFVQIYGFINMFLYSTAIYSGSLGTIMHPSFTYTFYFPILRYFRPVMAFVCLTVVSNNLHSYLCLTNALHWELKKFNHKIRQLKSTSSVEMREKLETLIYAHTQLSECIKLMDEIYQVYAFAVIACIIPLTIFILALVLSRTTFVEFGLSLAPVCFCTYEMYVIMYPARLHGELSRSKSLLCMNHNVWVPYEKSVNKLAHTLMMHLDQQDLGVSLWGFTLITKPLILTTVSAMLTCLAFFLDLKPKDEEKCDCSSRNLANLTGVT